MRIENTDEWHQLLLQAYQKEPPTNTSVEKGDVSHTRRFTYPQHFKKNSYVNITTPWNMNTPESLKHSRGSYDITTTRDSLRESRNTSRIAIRATR
jgi:hypothetical protein